MWCSSSAVKPGLAFTTTPTIRQNWPTYNLERLSKELYWFKRDHVYCFKFTSTFTNIISNAPSCERIWWNWSLIPILWFFQSFGRQAAFSGRCWRPEGFQFPKFQTEMVRLAPVTWMASIGYAPTNFTDICRGRCRLHMSVEKIQWCGEISDWTKKLYNLLENVMW